ncbi:MAG: DUF1232 domain-containing protein [Spirochaetales bacterium]|nr:DUF1232 domain-containing protein [Spirochaetales bacterium]
MAETKAFEDFHDFLYDQINSYSGPVKEYVYYLPPLFRALSGALGGGELAPDERRMALAALGYLAAPHDIVPEDVYGPSGWADDVFVCSLVLERLAKARGLEFVERYWEKQETDPLNGFLERAIEATRGDLGGKAELVLKFTGLGD